MNKKLIKFNAAVRDGYSPRGNVSLSAYKEMDSRAFDMNRKALQDAFNEREALKLKRQNNWKSKHLNRPKSKFLWENLLANRCPLCGDILEDKGEYFTCVVTREHSRYYKIFKKRFEEIINALQKK